MNTLTRLRLFCDPASIRLFLRTHALLRKDKRYSAINLLKAVWFASREDKAVRHDGQWIVSSFLPPMPSRAADQVMQAVPETPTRFEAMMTGRRLAPISMYVAITDRCPYRCEHCSATGREPVGDRDSNEMKALLRAIQDMGTAIIGLTGGEPLLRNDLCDLIAAMDDRSVSFLFTSGYGLTQERARALKRAGLFAAGISLDGDEASEMDARRGHVGAFEQATQAVRFCREAGLYTLTQTVAGRETLASGKLEKIVRLSGKLGAHEVRVLETMPSGRLTKIHPSLILTAQERKALKQFHATMNRRKDVPKVAVFAHTEDAQRYGCGAGSQHSYIDGAGNLYPCDFVPLAFGNIRDRPIAELWRAMHEQIGPPRQTCMLMELYAKHCFASADSFPLPPEQAETCIRKLDVMNQMPGFFHRLRG